MNSHAIWHNYSVYVCPWLQVLSVWEWTLNSDGPLCHTNLSTDYGRQTTLTFHPTDPSQLVSNSEDSVVFYHWVGGATIIQSELMSNFVSCVPLSLSL